MEPNLFGMFKDLARNLKQSVSPKQRHSIPIQNYSRAPQKVENIQYDQAKYNQTTQQFPDSVNSYTPPLMKIKDNIRSTSGNYSQYKLKPINSTYKKHDSIYKKTIIPKILPKRIKTQQARKSQDIKQTEQNNKCSFKTKAIQIKAQKGINKIQGCIQSKKIKDRQQQKNIFYNNHLNLQDSNEAKNQRLQSQQIIIKTNKTRAIKLGKVSQDKFYIKFQNKKGKKRQFLIKQTNFRDQIKSFAQLQALKKQFNQKLRGFRPPPQISAKSYLVAELIDNKITNSSLLKTRSEKNNKINKYLPSGHQKFKILASYNYKLQQQVASLTKIMTCILVIQICQRYCIPIKESQYQITQFQCQIEGTSANIRIGQIYKIQQLLYGLMLPSGNDASLALAVWTGNILLTDKFQLSSQIQIKHKRKQCLKRFVDEMNKKARILDLQRTKYSNPHGLNCLQNKSCSYDIVKLTNYCMKNSTFQNIVASIQHTSYVRYIVRDNTEAFINRKLYSEIESSLSTIDQKRQIISSQNLIQQMITSTQKNQKQSRLISNQKVKYRLVRWKNTHKLLNLKTNIYKGVKTGITSMAGACLSSFIEFKERSFIIVVLGCKSAAHRFKQTQILRKYIFKQQGLCSCADKIVKNRCQSSLQTNFCCGFYQTNQAEQSQGQSFINENQVKYQ